MRTPGCWRQATVPGIEAAAGAAAVRRRPRRRACLQRTLDLRQARTSQAAAAVGGGGRRSMRARRGRLSEGLGGTRRRACRQAGAARRQTRARLARCAKNKKLACWSGMTTTSGTIRMSGGGPAGGLTGGSSSAGGRAGEGVTELAVGERSGGRPAALTPPACGSTQPTNSFNGCFWPRREAGVPQQQPAAAAAGAAAAAEAAAEASGARGGSGSSSWPLGCPPAPRRHVEGRSRRQPRRRCASPTIMMTTSAASSTLSTTKAAIWPPPPPAALAASGPAGAVSAAGVGRHATASHGAAPAASVGACGVDIRRWTVCCRLQQTWQLQRGGSWPMACRRLAAGGACAAARRRHPLWPGGGPGEAARCQIRPTAQAPSPAPGGEGPRPVSELIRASTPSPAFAGGATPQRVKRYGGAFEAIGEQEVRQTARRTGARRWVNCARCVDRR